MSNLYTLYATSVNDAEQGKWFNFGPGVEIKIRRFKSKVSRKTRENLERPYRNAITKQVNVPKELEEEITNRHIAEGIIADWKGITDHNGNAVAYSPDAAYSFISDPRLVEFRDQVAAISLEAQNFKDSEEEEIEKN